MTGADYQIMPQKSRLLRPKIGSYDHVGSLPFGKAFHVGVPPLSRTSGFGHGSNFNDQILKRTMSAHLVKNF